MAEVLDLDEIDAARLLLDAQSDLDISDRSYVLHAVINFHEQRQLLIECLRLVFKCSNNSECEEEIKDVLRQLVALVLEIKDGPARNGSLYAQKCLQAMIDVEFWIRALGERYQGNKALGQPSAPEYHEILEFQQLNLEQQHESLASVFTYLIKANYTGVEDFYELLDHMPKLERWSSIVIHYVPIITGFASQYGSPEGSASLREARLLNTRIMSSRDSKPWTLRDLQAATITWWLSEYSGWYLEQPTGSPVQGIDLEVEAAARSDSVFRALREGAFQCTLSICSQSRTNDWGDEMRNSLREHLLQDSTAPINGASTISKHFEDLVMEQIETFTDAFITNMPDTLRRFGYEEDDQRKRTNSKLQVSARNGPLEHDLYLERFLVIISYAFENRVEAAQSFWADTDSNLYGFLQWASKRQSPPRMGAFCEMLRSISKGEECATSAHRFLLEEGHANSVRIRRTSSLSWAQIISDLELYITKISEHSANTRPPNQYSGRHSSDDIDEPESALMLECYLRLISHICRESTVARSWILDHQTFQIIDFLFFLCSNAVPSRIHASAFNTLRALLTGKTSQIGTIFWNTLDQWMSGGLSPPLNLHKPVKTIKASTWSQEALFDVIANDLEETSAFIGLLNSLVLPAVDESGLNDSLPFPEQLGSAYRTTGIEPYIDFVLGRIFSVQVHQLDTSLPLKILRLNILDFTATCLATFNEDLVVLANRSSIAIDTAMNASSLQAYVRLHPFGRVMEWMFNDRTLHALFASAHQDIEDVGKASPDDPMVLALLRSIDIMSLIMDLQSTYLDIVRPLVKVHGRSQSVLNPSLASFEDSVAFNLHLIVDLGLYCGVGIQQLTISSLKLLAKFTASRQLNAHPVPGLNKRLDGNRLVDVLEQDHDLEQFARSLILALRFDSREISFGPLAPGWATKSAILDFLTCCLSFSFDKPTLAHALLGFHCAASTLDIEADGLFARGSSLFHAVLQIIIDYPDGIEGNMQSWSLSLRQKSLQVLSSLWRSPLTSVFTLTELRTSDFFFALFLKQTRIEPSTLWDGRIIRDPEFIYTESAQAMEEYLQQRRYCYEYASAEIKLIATEKVPSLQARIMSTLLGTTLMADGEQTSNLNVFDLFDIAELEIVDHTVMPEYSFFTDIDFSVSLGLDLLNDTKDYNLKILEDMLSLQLNQMGKNGRFQDAGEEQKALLQAQNLILYFHSKNKYRHLNSIRSLTLKAWAKLLTLSTNECSLDQTTKAGLILRSTQILVPKLEHYAIDGTSDAIDIANLLQALLLQFDFKSSKEDGTRAGDEVGANKFFQLFRVALRSIHVPDGDVQLREILYNICCQYLTGMAESLHVPIRHGHGIRTIRAAGEKIIDIICDDAYDGPGTCRISAILLLDSLVALAKSENSSYVIDSMGRTNFIIVIVETIKDIPQELKDTVAKG